jgi:hypothetical protein
VAGPAAQTRNTASTPASAGVKESGSVRSPTTIFDARGERRGRRAADEGADRAAESEEFADGGSADTAGCADD